MVTLHKVKTKLGIHTNRKSMLTLEGEYVSSLKGKSLDFDDLREYVYGDDVRDIDWRASAKQQVPLVKRYVANRKHNVLFVVDTSITMTAAAPDYTAKQELAQEAVGLLGYIAVKHHDNTGLMVLTDDRLVKVPFLSGENHVNRIMNLIEKSTYANQGIVDMELLIKKADLSLNSETIMVIVSNEATPNESMKKLIRKIQHRHDVLWLTISDINPVSIPKKFNVFDVADIVAIPDGLRDNNSLSQQMYQDEEDRKQNLRNFLTSLRVSNADIAHSMNIIPTLITLLKRRDRNGKR